MQARDAMPALMAGLLSIEMVLKMQQCMMKHPHRATPSLRRSVTLGVVFCYLLLL